MRVFVLLAVLALVCGCMSTPEKATTTTLKATALTEETTSTLKQGALKGRRPLRTMPDSVTETTQPDPCTLKKRQIREEIRKLSRCSVDSDCVATELFGCYSIINDVTIKF